MKQETAKEEMRYIVRIAGKDLDGTKPIFSALRGIKGISHRFARVAAIQFEKETGIKFDSRLGTIPENHDKTLEAIITEPEKHGFPEWMLNRRKDFYTGKSSHLIMGDLDFAKREDIKRLNIIKSYRGLRHSWGLPVRGQRTKSTHRGKGPVVGVMKKEAKKGGGGQKKEGK
ncbi:MAG: 30S ribosomal protein S13 [Candidatus Diapherotrites archaeon]